MEHIVDNCSLIKVASLMTVFFNYKAVGIKKVKICILLQYESKLIRWIGLYYNIKGLKTPSNKKMFLNHQKQKPKQIR